MRCTYLILVAIAMLIVLGCSDSSDLEKARQEAKTAAAEVEKLRTEFELAKLKAERELADAKAKQAASEADADTSKAALGFIGMRDLPAVRQPGPEWTPQELLAAYFNAPSWLHRVPLVKDCERVKPLMKSHYGTARIKPMEFEVLRLAPESAEIGNTLTATVKLATDTTDYMIFRSAEGYRVDWESSREKWLAAEEARFREAHGLVNASVHAKLVKQGQSGNFPELTFEFTNHSDAYLANATIEVTAFGKSGRYLQKGLCFVRDLPPGKSTFESITLVQIAPSDLKTWNMKMSQVSIQTRSGGTESADKYFELKEIGNTSAEWGKKGKKKKGAGSLISVFGLRHGVVRVGERFGRTLVSQ